MFVPANMLLGLADRIKFWIINPVSTYVAEHEQHRLQSADGKRRIDVMRVADLLTFSLNLQILHLNPAQKLRFFNFQSFQFSI